MYIFFLLITFEGTAVGAGSQHTITNADRDATLELKSSQLWDEGRYTCSYVFKDGTTVNNTAFLDVVGNVVQ